MKGLKPIMSDAILFLLILGFFSYSGHAKGRDHEKIKKSFANFTEKNHRDGRFLIPVVQIVNFPNDICDGGGTRNGTCYTAEECNNRGGSNSGTCANGFGVCCVFTLTCGSTTSENCTFLVQESTTTTPSQDPCTYTICKTSTNVCRIRLDFNTFQIASPQAGTTGSATVTANVGGAIGDCISDTFSFTSPGNDASPIICGFNSGQHMIVDASDACNVAAFDIGSTSDTRQWDIKVTQYACGTEEGGPDGCLQYFTGSTGTISSFNFPTTASSVGSTTTHLSNQCYSICIRVEEGMCSICYLTAITVTTTAPTAQNSFGLSLAGAIIAQSAQESNCNSDYLVIPAAQAAPVILGTFPNAISRLCGRFFDSTDASAISTNSVCSQQRPFTIIFKTDADESTTGTSNVANTNEQSEDPGGIVGFSISYSQNSCS